MRHPKKLKKIKNEKDEKIIKLYIKYDIYSFGVLVHEIITTISIINRIKREDYQEVIKHLKNNYYKFLFKEFEDIEEFDKKYNIEGIGEFILKCMNATEREAYSSVKEMMIDLNKIIDKFPVQMKEEINTRIINSTKSTKYKYDISDLIINCCIGNEMSENLISLYLKKHMQQLYHILDFKNNAKIVIDNLTKPVNEFDDIIKNSLINSTNQTDIKLTNNQTKLSITLNFYNGIQ